MDNEKKILNIMRWYILYLFEPRVRCGESSGVTMAQVISQKTDSKLLQ